MKKHFITTTLSMLLIAFSVYAAPPGIKYKKVKTGGII